MTNKGRVEMLVLKSECLRNNPLRDPATREVPVYLPPGYDGRTRYPTLYCLAGYTGFGTAMLGRGAWSESLDQQLDRLHAEGCPPVVVVMPDCMTRWGGSQYMNSPALGRYEDHLVQEVVDAVDARFRTLASREGRGVFGKSSGGYGALRMAFHHPDRFAAVACHSGDMFFEWSYQPDFPRFANAVGRQGGVDAFLEYFFSKYKHSSDDVLSLSVLAMAAAYSPDARAPHGVALPFDLHTGTMIPEVWQRWKEQDPLVLVERHGEALRRLDLLFLDCGRRDEYNLHFGARQFMAACQARDIPCEYEEFDDGHRGLSYRYDTSIPKLARALAPAQPAP